MNEKSKRVCLFIFWLLIVVLIFEGEILIRNKILNSEKRFKTRGATITVNIGSEKADLKKVFCQRMGNPLMLKENNRFLIILICTPLEKERDEKERDKNNPENKKELINISLPLIAVSQPGIFSQ